MLGDTGRSLIVCYFKGKSLAVDHIRPPRLLVKLRHPKLMRSCSTLVLARSISPASRAAGLSRWERVGRTTTSCPHPSSLWETTQ